MEADELFAKLRPLMGEKLERLRLAYLAEDEDGKREIETILRLTYAKRTNEKINVGQILLPPPNPAVAAGEFVLGDVVYNDKKLHPFGLRRDELIQHMAIFGRSGSGKTNTVFQMIGQLLKTDIPFLIFDWKRNYRDLLSLTDKEALVFTVGRPVAPIQFNPLIPPPGVEPQVHLKLLVNIIAKAYFCGDGVISLLQQAIDAVYAESGIYDGTNGRYPIMKDVLTWLEKCPAKGRAANWMASTLRAVRSLCFGQMGMHLFGELKVGQAVVKLQDRHVRPFLVEFPLIGVRKGAVTDTIICEKMKRYLSDTAAPAPPMVDSNPSQPVPAAEETDNDSIGTTSNSSELNFIEVQFLTDVLRHPEYGIVQRTRTLNLSRRKVHAVKLALTRRGLIEPVDVSTGSGRTVLLVLTADGKAVLQNAGVDTSGYLSRGGVEHEFWRARIDESLRDQGYTVTHEYHIDGNGAVDILAVQGAERLVVEIETGQSDVVENVRKCLAAGFERVMIAATSHAAEQKVRRQLGDLAAADERVEVILCPHRF